jgi:hypothetical protein
MAAKKKIRNLMVDATGKKVVTSAPTALLGEPEAAAPPAPAGAFFTTLMTNVKAPQRTMTLGACTAIVSPRNRAGKTATLDAFRLALTGKHPIGSDAVDLIGLTPDGQFPYAALRGERAQAAFQFPDGRRTPEVTVTGELQAVADRTTLLPLVSFKDLLTLGTAKARDALFARFGDGKLFEQALVAPKGMTDEQGKLWDAALAGDGRLGSNDTVVRLSLAGSWIRSHKNALGKQTTSLEEEKRKLHDLQVTAGPGAPTEDLLRGVQEKISAHMVFNQTHILRERAEVSKSRLQTLVLEITPECTPGTPENLASEPFTDEELTHRKNNINARWGIAELRARLQGNEASLAAVKGNSNIYKMVLQLREHLTKGACMVCGCTPDAGAVPAMVEQMRAAVENFDVTVEPLQLQVHQSAAALKAAQLDHDTDVYALEEDAKKRKARRERIQQDVRMAKTAYEAAQQMLEAAGIPSSLPSESLQVLQEQLRALQAAKAQADRVTTLAADLRRIEMEKLDVKSVEKELAERLGQLIAQIREKAQQSVNAWMPPGFTAALMLEDEDGKPACRWEVIGSDGRAHPYGAASGAEWAALSVAIACAWSDNQKYRFLLLDDADLAGFSAENVKNTLTMLGQAVAESRLTQVLVAWSRPEEIPDKGWTVVSL